MKYKIPPSVSISIQTHRHVFLIDFPTFYLMSLLPLELSFNCLHSVVFASIFFFVPRLNLYAMVDDNGDGALFANEIIKFN